MVVKKAGCAISASGPLSLEFDQHFADIGAGEEAHEGVWRLFDAVITVQADVAGVTFDDQGATPDSTWLLICDQSGGQGHRQLELTPIGRVLTETYGSDDQSC